MDVVFGTDGIRGIPNVNLSPEVAYSIGRAAGLAFRGGDEPGIAVIGKDTRRSGAMIEASVASGLLAAGVDTRHVGTLPTPGIAMLTRTTGARLGVAITASHNPPCYNGIKLFDSHGRKISLSHESAIARLLGSQNDAPPMPTGNEVGNAEILTSASETYSRWLVSTARVDLRGLRIVLDCANGSASRLAPSVFGELGAQVIPIHNSPNGTNINLKCGSLFPSSLQEAVLDSGANIGLAFDGDADRVIAVDERGAVHDGDSILGVLALTLNKKATLARQGIVATHMSNFGLKTSLEQHGIEVVLTDVGDRSVVTTMVSEGINLGGEQSGHVIMSDYSLTGDGILVGLQLALACMEERIRLSQMASGVRRLPQVLISVPVHNPALRLRDPGLQEAMEATKRALGTTGRLIVRPSGTEPVLRVLVESSSMALAHKSAQSIKRAIDYLGRSRQERAADDIVSLGAETSGFSADGTHILERSL